MSDTQLVERLEKLERDNRRLKGFAVAALVLAAAFGTIYATRPVPQKITAHEFDVVDSSGRVRITLDRFSLNFFDESGRLAIALLNATNGAGLVFYGRGNQKIGKFSWPVSRMQLNSWGLYLDDKEGNTAIELGGVGKADSPIPELMLQGASPLISLGDWQGKPRIGMAIVSDEPSISLFDAQGFQMDLGSTGKINARTGATEQTSAASIVMFGKDEKVIWQAP